jgi:hypothetical protein
VSAELEEKCYDLLRDLDRYESELGDSLYSVHVWRSRVVEILGADPEQENFPELFEELRTFLSARE